MSTKQLPIAGMPASAQEDELSGPFDFDALARSLNAVVGRHEALRTTFTVDDERVVQVAATLRPIGRQERVALLMTLLWQRCMCRCSGTVARVQRLRSCTQSSPAAVRRVAGRKNFEETLPDVFRPKPADDLMHTVFLIRDDTETTGLGPVPFGDTQRDRLGMCIQPYETLGLCYAALHIRPCSV